MAADQQTSGVAAKGEEFRVRCRGGLSPQQVKELSQLSPLRATISLLQNWAIVAGGFVAVYYRPDPWVVIVAILAIAAAQHGLAILAHQSAHYRMYQTGWLNDLVGRLCAYPLGISMLTYRIIHRIHHNHLYESIDPDLALMAGYPRGKSYLFKKLAKDLFGITTLKNYYYFFGVARKQSKDQPTVDPLADTSPRLRAAATRDRQLVFIFNLLLLVLLLVTGGWRLYLLLWLLPLASLLQLLLRLRAVCEHGAVADTSQPFQAARTNLSPFWLRWFLFPHHMHYHIEHHLYPSVPHYRLADCHLALKRLGALEGAEVSPNFTATLAKIFADPPIVTKLQ